MAQKRMVDKKISVSEQVANLSLEAQIIFTWAIPHADDIGFLPHSHRTLKATVVPMHDFTLEKFSEYIAKIVKEELWREIEYKGQKYYFIVKFQDHQTLKKDRQPQTIIPFTLDKDPKTSWKELNDVLETLGIQLEDTGNQMASEVKRSEEKRSEYSMADFEKFWTAYPRKVNKKQAAKSWLKIKPDEALTKKILAALEQHKQSAQWTKDDGQFIPHPATWLNQERWNDEMRPGKTKVEGSKYDGVKGTKI